MCRWTDAPFPAGAYAVIVTYPRGRRRSSSSSAPLENRAESHVKKDVAELFTGVDLGWGVVGLCGGAVSARREGRGYLSWVNLTAEIPVAVICDRDKPNGELSSTAIGEYFETHRI